MNEKYKFVGRQIEGVRQVKGWNQHQFLGRNMSVDVIEYPELLKFYS